MKNYYLTKEKNADFIKNYEIKEDTIEIQLPLKKTLLLKNTHKNRTKINEKMDDQIRQAYSYVKYRAIFFVVLTLITIPFLVGPFSITNCITMIADVVAISIFGHYFLDAKKNYNFYKNRNELNSTLETDPNLLEGIKEKTKEMLVNQPTEEQIFNYNSIDRLTYLELRQILLNLKLAKKLNFEYVKSQNQYIQEEAIRRNRHMKIVK